MCTRSLMLLLVVLPVLTGGRGAGGAGGGGGGGGPAFARRQRTALLARAGDAADLSCRVLRLADRAVSWVRSSDLQILTHAGTVFTADARVSCAESSESAESDAAELEPPEDGPAEEPEPEAGGSVHTLRIARLRLSDSGRYECQINTEPKMSLFFNLTVVESAAAAPRVVVWAEGGGVAEGREGGAARLACAARLEPAALTDAPPLRIVWAHEGRALDAQSLGAGVSLETERWAGGARSRLTLAPLRAHLAGRYTCRARSPSAPAAAAELLLRVLPDTDDTPAGEMQRDEAAAARAAAGGAAGGGAGGVRVARGAGGALLPLLLARLAYACACSYT